MTLGPDEVTPPAGTPRPAPREVWVVELDGGGVWRPLPAPVAGLTEHAARNALQVIALSSPGVALERYRIARYVPAEDPEIARCDAHRLNVARGGVRGFERCTKPAGHDGAHLGAEDSTWSDRKTL